MFITKKKLDALLERERMEVYARHEREMREAETLREIGRIERNLWDRMNDLERQLNQRIDNLAELTLPEEAKQKHTCPLCQPVKF